MQAKLATVLVVTAHSASALKLGAQTDPTDVEMDGFAQGMAEHLLFTGCDDSEGCRDGEMYIDLRGDEQAIEDHVLVYINEVLDRSDDSESTDYEKEAIQKGIHLLIEEDVENAKRFIAGAVTDYFRDEGQSYIDQNADGIRQTVEQKVACEVDGECDSSSSGSEESSGDPDESSGDSDESSGEYYESSGDSYEFSDDSYEFSGDSGESLDDSGESSEESQNPTPAPIPPITGSKFFIPEQDGEPMTMDFVGAQQACQERGGQLASIRSQAENEEAQAIMSEENMWQGHWIGYTDEEVEDQFRWLDGSESVYTNWNGDGGAWQEPNNFDGNENCTEITFSGGWNDNNCDYPKRFICRSNDHIF